MKAKTNLIFTFVFLYLAIGAFLPFNSLYLENILAFNKEEIGFIYAIAAIFAAIFVPLSGLFADKINNTKLAYIACTIILILISIPYMYTKHFFTVTLIYMIYQGFRSALLPLLDSIGLDYAHYHNDNFGFIRAFGSFGFILGSLICGYLMSVFSQYSQLFIYLHLFFLILSVALISKQANHRHLITKNTHFKEDSIALFHNKKYLLLLVICALANAINQVAQMFLPFSITGLGGNDSIVGISFLFLAAPEIFLFTFTLKLAKKISHIKVIILGSSLLLFRWFVLIMTNNLVILLLISMIHAVVMAFVVLCIYDLVKKIVSNNLVATAITLLSGVTSIVVAGLVYLVGIIYNSAGVLETYYLYGIISIVVLLISGIYFLLFGRGSYESSVAD